MIKKLMRASISLALFFVLLATPSAAFASNILSPPTPGAAGGVCNDPTTPAAKNSAACQQAGNANNPLTGCPSKCGSGIIYDIVNILTFLSGGAAVIILIVSALRFATSGSDISTNSRTDTDVENARRSIVDALVGLVIIIAARYLIFFVLSRI